jgi:glycosyltransferase involved in cell wall biosynthesis
VRIAVCHNQPSGGARRALHGFCTELRARHQIDAFALDTADDEWLRDCDVADRVERHPVRRRRPVRLGLYVNDVIAALERRDLDGAYKMMAERVDSGDYDVALVDVCRYSLVPSLLTRLRTPSVFYAHGPPAWLEGHAWDPPLTAWERARRIWHLPVTRAVDGRAAARQRAAARAATVVATNSRHMALRLRAAYGVEPVVCPPGVPLPPVTTTPRSSFVLSVGEVEPRKGHAFVVDALARLPSGLRPPLRVMANAANPTELARICRRAEEAGVALEVRVAPPETVLRWSYAQAALFVYAAHHEPFGLAPLEAMAHGTPVVAVAEGGVAETVLSGVTGYLASRSEGRFAEHVRQLLDDEVLRSRMGRAARAHVEARWALAPRAKALEELLLATAGPAGTTGVERAGTERGAGR